MNEGHEREIAVQVLIPHEAAMSGRVGCIDAEGLHAVMVRDTSLPLGERVRVALSIDGVARAAVTRAVVAGRHERQQEREYVFRFLSRVEVDQALPRGLYAMANRRRSDRFRLAVPLKVAISAPRRSDLEPHRSRAVAMLDGASQEGCSLIVDGETERAFANVERITLEVRSSCHTEDSGTIRWWRVDATISHRQLCDDGDVRYGCRLDPSPNREQLIAFLLDRDLEAKDAEVG
jgi:hypothetical protein